MGTITADQQKAIVAKLDSMPFIPSGLGDEHRACSIASINLALTGRLTDDVPECMSDGIGRWIIRVQDAMPDEVRNSACWRGLLPLAAGTGRSLERERAAVALDWMWGTVLPQLQPIADAGGYGDKWLAMTTERTPAAAAAACWSAAAAADAVAAATAAATAADAVAAVAAAAATRWSAAADAATRREFWLAVDPCACLARMIEVG